MSAPAAVAMVEARISTLRAQMGLRDGVTQVGASQATDPAFAAAMASASAPSSGLSPAASPGQGLTGLSLSGAAGAAGAAGALGSLGGLGSPGAAGGAAPQARAAVAEALKFVGTPYVWGGESPREGFDCSGLVQWAYKQQGISIPRVSSEQVHAGRAVPVSKASLLPGDLLFTNYSARGPEHVVMYIGDGKVVEAPGRGKQLRVREIDLDTVREARRIVPASAAPAAAAPGAAGDQSWAARLPSAAAPYVSTISAAAARRGVDPALLASVLWTESGFNPRAVSPAGAIGIAQIMPATAAGLGVNPRDPGQAIDGAARLLASGVKKFGSAALSAAAYNAGPGAVTKYGGIPPYAETRAYVDKVTARVALLTGAAR